MFFYIEFQLFLRAYKSIFILLSCLCAKESVIAEIIQGLWLPQGCRWPLYFTRRASASKICRAQCNAIFMKECSLGRVVLALGGVWKHL